VTLPLITLLALQATVAAQRPADVVREATHAIESDSVGPAVARWRAVLARDSTNLAARLGLATIARLTYDFASADRHYAAIEARAPALGTTYRAWSALGRAESRIYRLPFDSVTVWYDSAATLARAAGDSIALANVLYGAGMTRSRTSLPAVALATVDSGLRIPGQDSGLLAYGRCVRSFALWSQGNVKSGEEAAAGLALARAARDRRRAAACLMMLGQHRLTTGDDAAAAAFLDTAVATALEARDRSSAAANLWWRGHHKLERYEHDGAQRDLSAALVESDASGNNFIAGFAWIRLSVVSWHFGDMLSARRQLERGRVIVRDLGDGWGVTYARSIGGSMALEAGQIDAAEAAFREGIAWGEKRGEPLEQLNGLFGLARIAMVRGDWSLARERFAQAERLLRRHGILGYIPQLEYENGLVSLRAGDLADAERRFNKVLADGATLTDLDRYAARSRIAEIHLLRGDAARAERELVAATDAIDSLRAALGERELRVLAFQAHKGYDDTDLGFPTIIDGLAAAGRVPAALALAERRRARDLHDRIVRGGDRLTPTGQATLLRQSNADTPVERQLPDERTAILEYVTGAGSQPTTLFVVTSRGIRAVRRPPAASVAEDMSAFSGLVEAGAGGERLARSLADAVFGTALDSLPAEVERLIVVADGPLQRLPFDALRTRDGRYLVERFAVSLAPSIAVAAELRSRPHERDGPARVLAFGDPRFANEVSSAKGSAADVYREAFSMNGGLPRLRGSAAEAELVARFADRSELRLRERASERFLKTAALDSFDVIHLATHALVDERSIARTALAVADGDGDDGFVGPGELSALRLNARLVVLSACRTASGVAVRGEGVQGLTAPLLATGARSVLATQWRIRDQDAVHFIEDFYRALANGAMVGDAARTAKLAAIARGSSPASWAAFTVVGDPFVTVPVRAPVERVWWILLMAGLAALGTYGVAMRMRRAADRNSVPSDNRAVTRQ